MVSTAILESGGDTHQVLQKAAVAADGHFGAFEKYVFQFTGDSSIPNPVTFSGDGQNIYMAIPSIAVSA